MDNRTFIEKCLKWQELMEEAAEIAKELEAETLKLGKTQTVGDVRVTFSKGRGSYNYETAWMDSSNGEEPPEQYGEMKWDYRKACADYGIDTKPYYAHTSGPSAKIKLL